MPDRELPRRRRPDLPRLGPRDLVVLVGPEVEYVVVGLETSGADAKLRLRTVDGLDWTADRSPLRAVPDEDGPADA